MKARFGASLVAGVALASLVSRGASAETSLFELPPACGSESEFRTELVRLVGADAERAWPATLHILRDEPNATYVLKLEVGGRTRELSHADCRVLFRSALVVAAASVRPPLEAAPAPAPATEAEPAPEPKPAPQPDSIPSDSPPLQPTLALGAGLALGVVPNADAAFELRAGLMRGLLGASLAVRYLPPRFVSTEGRGVDIQGLGFRLAGVVTPWPALALSAGLDADWLSGTGTSGIDKPSTDSAWTLAPSLEAALIPFKNNHLALELAVEGRLALQRPHFEVTGFRQVYEVPRFGLFALARGSWRFP